MASTNVMLRWWRRAARMARGGEEGGRGGAEEIAGNNVASKWRARHRPKM